jgi:hypothetical protein
MRRSRTLLALVLSLPGISAVATGQEPWKASYYPYPLKGPNDKVSLVLHYQYGQAADYTDPVPFNGSVSVEAGANADGSRFLTSRFKAPRLVKGWRFFAEVGSVRENRFGYFGLGNDALEDPDNPGAPYETRVGRTRHLGRLEATRVIAGPFHLAVGVGFTDASYRALPGFSRFESDFYIAPPCLPPPTECLPPPGDPSGSDATLRVSLVLDTRDSEFLTTRGVLLEGGVFGGTGGDGYRGYYGIARGYAALWTGAVLAGRVLGRHLSGEAPLDTRFEVGSWERNIPVLGGPESHRSFVYGRYAGRDVLLGNLEVRQTILDVGDFGAVGAVAFLDAGLVKEGVEPEPNNLHVGGGAGVTLRILRSTLLGLNFAGGGDGFRFSMGTGWSF